MVAVSNLRIRSGELSPDPDVALGPGLGKAIEDAQAEMQRLIQLGELQNDPIRHPIQALSVHLDALLKLSTAHSQALTRQSGAAFTDEQVDDIGRRLLGSCQAWSRSLERAAMWRSWAALAAIVLAAIVLGFGAGWSYRGDLPTIAGLSAGANKCEDRPDGSRLCWIPVWERLPPGKGP
jgi:hypothetical protein